MREDGIRDFYLAIAHSSDEPEALPMAEPLDLPDWDWPDAPEPADPRVNDRLEKHLAWGWLAISGIITTGSLAYLLSLVQW